MAYGGVHPPEEMPFGEAWTDADPRYLGRGILQYYWRSGPRWPRSGGRSTSWCGSTAG